MASKFRITAHRAGHTLRLSLSGDLDGSSACEILNYIRNHNVPDQKILINGMAINQEIFDNTVFSIGYLNDEFADDVFDNGTEDKRHTFFTQVAIEF
jgi:hypothetical protein